MSPEWRELWCCDGVAVGPKLIVLRCKLQRKNQKLVQMWWHWQLAVKRCVVFMMLMTLCCMQSTSEKDAITSLFLLEFVSNKRSAAAAVMWWHHVEFCMTFSTRDITCIFLWLLSVTVEQEFRGKTCFSETRKIRRAMKKLSLFGPLFLDF